MKLTTIGFALAAVCVLGSLGAYLDGLDAPPAAQELPEDEKQRNAQVFCTATAGESVVVWDADGEFHCKRRRK